MGCLLAGWYYCSTINCEDKQSGRYFYGIENAIWQTGQNKEGIELAATCCWQQRTVEARTIPHYMDC